MRTGANFLSGWLGVPARQLGKADVPRATQGRRDQAWLADKLAGRDLAPAMALQPHWPRRADVVAGGRPSALLERPTTPLFDKR